MRKAIIIILVLVLVGGLGAGIFLWMQYRAAQEDIAKLTGEIEHPEMNKDEIRAGLLSDDITVRLDAEAQMDKFPPEERINVLAEICKTGDRGARLLVIEQLGKMRDVPKARAMLEDLASNDPERMVQLKAKKVLKTFDKAPPDPSTKAPPTESPEVPEVRPEEAPVEPAVETN